MNQKSLTQLGRLRRQRKFVYTALARYPVEFDRVRLVSAHTNFIYRVRDVEGRLYALRLVMPGWRSEQNLDAEVAWLRALESDTDIPVPKIIVSADGEPYVRMTDERLNVQRRAFLTSWLPGTLLGKRLNPQNVGKVGVLLAKLHLHAREWVLPSGFPNIAFTGFLGRDEPDLLFDDRHNGSVPPQMLDALNAARRVVDCAYEAKSNDELLAIHCDLHHENIKIHRGILAPIDFEDVVLGYREHDIAMTLLDLAEDVSNETYKVLLKSFVEGYQSVISYPESDILPFQLGRILWQLNWIARFQPEHLVAAAQQRSVILKYALDVGQLRVH